MPGTAWPSREHPSIASAWPFTRLATDLNWVLSGINAGGNLGTDVYHSGTVAAVREAAIRGRARDRGLSLHRAGASDRLGPGGGLDRPGARAADGDARGNPGPSGTSICPTLPRAAPSPRSSSAPSILLRCRWIIRVEGDLATYAGDYQGRARRPGADVAVCFGGQISVTLVRLSDIRRSHRPRRSRRSRASGPRKAGALRSGRFLPSHDIMGVREGAEVRRRGERPPRRWFTFR